VCLDSPYRMAFASHAAWCTTSRFVYLEPVHKPAQDARSHCGPQYLVAGATTHCGGFKRVYPGTQRAGDLLYRPSGPAVCVRDLDLGVKSGWSALPWDAGRVRILIASAPFPVFLGPPTYRTLSGLLRASRKSGPLPYRQEQPRMARRRGPSPAFQFLE